MTMLLFLVVGSLIWAALFGVIVYAVKAACLKGD